MELPQAIRKMSMMACYTLVGGYGDTAELLQYRLQYLRDRVEDIKAHDHC